MSQPSASRNVLSIGLAVCTGATALALGGDPVSAVPDIQGESTMSVAGTNPLNTVGTAESGSATSFAESKPKLDSALNNVHRAGMPGIFAEVRDGDQTWRGSSGVADLDTGRPVQPNMRQRVGSITKTFVAAAVLRQVEAGEVHLDAPISRYLPQLVPGERGDTITVRMLLNHTSGLPDYLPYAFESLQQQSPKSLDDNRFRQFQPEELIAMGVTAPPAAEPGSTPGVYSNTNYLLLGQLLEKVTGTTAQRYITENVIKRAGFGTPNSPPGHGSMGHIHGCTKRCSD